MNVYEVVVSFVGPNDVRDAAKHVVVGSNPIMAIRQALIAHVAEKGNSSRVSTIQVMDQIALDGALDARTGKPFDTSKWSQ